MSSGEIRNGITREPDIANALNRKRIMDIEKFNLSLSYNDVSPEHFFREILV